MAQSVQSPTTAGMVILRVPQEAWAILEETLALDAVSSAFDPALRQTIARALAQVEIVEEKHGRR